MKRTPVKGMTLVEVLISMGILGIIMAVMYETLVPSLRGLNRTSVETEVQQSAVIAGEKIREKLKISTPYSITNTSKAISFLSQDRPISTSTVDPSSDSANFSNSGVIAKDIYWKKFEIIYFDKPSYSIRCKEIALSPTNQKVWKLTSAGVNHFKAENLPETVIARNIYNADFYIPRYPCVMVDVVAYKSHTGLDFTKKRNESKARIVSEILPQN
ncbi:MAG: type II secretion system protein [Vulcanimicrobiota bacterium]